MRRRFFCHSKKNDALIIEPLEDGFRLKGSSESMSYVFYSINNRGWSVLYSNEETPEINRGDVLMVKSDTYTSFGYSGLKVNKKFKVSGNVYAITGGTFDMNYFFYNCENLVAVAKDFLPATTLADGCYRNMFDGCTSLITAPDLPATTLANYCYEDMFRGCTSLITAPALPATTLADGCYRNMFRGCTSLTTAPDLPATTLANYCYSNMFDGCTSLTTAPDLPATTLLQGCYIGMFDGCSSLNYIKMLATDKSASYCLDNWVRGVASTGTFVKNKDATWTTTGPSGVPSGWTVITDDQEGGGSDSPKPPVQFPLYIESDYSEPGMMLGTTTHYSNTLGEEFYTSLRNYLREMTRMYGERGHNVYYLYNLSEYGIEIYVGLSDSWSIISGFDAYDDGYVTGFHDGSVIDSGVYFYTDSIEWAEDNW